MDIAQLRNFLRIVELGSFTGAARACGLTQPALSQQIARLEAELGCPVLERLGRHVTPTDAGERLRRQAEQIVALVDDAVREVKDDGETGKVSVAAIPTIAPYFLPAVLGRFRERCPAARIEVNEETTESLVRRCQQGEIDVGILALPAEARHLEVEPLFDEELLVVLPAGHPLADRPSVAMNDVRAEPFVLLEEAHCLSEHILSFCQKRRFQPIATGRANQLATIQELVALGLGVSFIPEMARKLDASPRRAYRPVEGKRPTRSIAACWNPHRYRSKLSAKFLQAVRDEAG
ncbi:MAG: hydrogen peroxide-inducible genes activator [Isosphaeraceae bacterium]